MSASEDIDIKTEKNPEAADMVVASKEVSPDRNEMDSEKGLSTDEGMFAFAYSVAKKVIIVGTIYLVGYMGWSIAWLITPVVLSVARDQWRKSMEHKRNIAKSSALACEKDVILARLDELPAWVYFPDVERCEWVNRILKQLWPNANHFARDLVKNSIEPNIASALSKYKFNGFKFDRVILGTIPPRIGGVKIYDKNVSRNEIVMDLDLFYASDCDINFVLSGVKGGIKDFQIHGIVRVVLKPLIRSMPLVGGVQIYFLNNPNIDFNLVGIADLLDMPGLSDMLRRIVVEQFAAVMVLPNKISVSLSDDVPARELKMPEPEGVLRIHVVEAKDLMKKDISVLGKGKSDPYCIVTVGAQEFRTKVIDNNVNPKWDFWCEAPVFTDSGQFIEVQLYDRDDTKVDECLGRKTNSIFSACIDVLLQTVVGIKLYDWDRAGEHDPLGRATIEISNVIKRGDMDAWLVLEDAKHGMVHVRLTWHELSTEPTDLQAALEETQLLRITSMSSAILSVYVDSAKNLPQARSQSKPDPYAVLSLGKQSEQTSTQMRTDSPVWEQGFSFLVSNPENDTLQFKIMDQKTGGVIGQFTYNLNALLAKKKLEILSEPFQLQKSGPESKLLLSLALRILKEVEIEDDEDEEDAELSVENYQISDVSNLSRTSSVQTSNITESSPARKHEGNQMSSIVTDLDADEVKEDMFLSQHIQNVSATPPRSPKMGESSLVHRHVESTNSAGEAGLGRIQITLRYSIQRQKLTVIIHKIMNIPLTDPSNIPDPYVKLYLLPSRSKESKRKTNVVKDNCNPVYDATYEYIISSAEMMSSALEVTVCTQKGFLYGGSPVIGMHKIALSNPDISNQGYTTWYDLLPEVKHE